MASSSLKSDFRAGFLQAAPLGLVVGPFGVVFGVLATEAGLNVLEALTFSVAVIAGAAQITAIQLMQQDAPTVIVLISALAVNLRMVMYSAALTPHFGALPVWRRAIAAYFTVDQSFAMSVDRFDRAPAMTLEQKFAYFLGTALSVCPLWYIGTGLGAVAGGLIPAAVPLDFAVPITFIAMIAPMLRTRAHVAAAVTAVLLALALAGLPWNLGLLVAGLGGMVAGAEVERRRQAK